MKVISLTSRKGGVLKSTHAVNLAAALGMDGKQVLLIDTDAQCNSTETLITGKTRKDPRLLSPSSYDVLLDEGSKLDLSKVIRKNTREENVHLLPSSSDMDGIDAQLSEQALWGLALKRRLPELAAMGYHYVVIDTPPASTRLKSVALYASDLAILPVIPSKYALDGLAEVIEEIGMIEEATRRTVDYRVLLGRVRYYNRKLRKPSMRAYLELAEFLEGGRLMRTMIPDDDLALNAEEWSSSIIRYAPKSEISRAYIKLMLEVEECLSD